MEQTETLAELVAHAPERAIVLERLGLDYCCGGSQRFDDACAQAGLDPAAVEAQLDAIAEPENAHVCAGREPTELIAHLLDDHHAYLHEELPALEALAAKVSAVHGARHPELAEVRELVALIAADLEPHMMKEERVLFPAIQQLVEGASSEFAFGSINNPIRMMTLEHERAGDLFARLRSATHEYVTPADGCASYRALNERLAHLDHDTRLHIFEENQLLFPQIVALAEAMLPAVRVKAHPGLCQGWGECNRGAPELYPLDAEGKIDVHVMDVPGEYAEDAWWAAGACPVQAITVIGPPAEYWFDRRRRRHAR